MTTTQNPYEAVLPREVKPGDVILLTVSKGKPGTINYVTAREAFRVLANKKIQTAWKQVAYSIRVEGLIGSRRFSPRERIMRRTEP